jgi:uncharacterized protein YjiS (DUF1127 family)
MPPHQTNLIPETGRDAAAPGLDVPIALVKQAMDGASAPARPDAAVAALRGASPDQDAAGPAAASMLRALGLLRRYWRASREWRQRRRLHVPLRDMSDRQLIDIGVTSAEIDAIAAQRTLDRLRDGTAYLWVGSRGVM